VIKSNSPQMQNIHSDVEVKVTPERRAELAIRGKRLYAKYCGTSGTGICAESFAEYHVWRGELVIARDLLVYLYAQRDQLSEASNQRLVERLAMTEELITRIKALLGETETELAIEVIQE
jgi:hypothetical protein